MITGFEEITADLTEKEKIQCRILYTVFSNELKKGDPVKNDAIRELMRVNHGIKIGSAKLRKMVHWMHVNGYLSNLIASNSGYSIAKNIHELMDYEKSLSQRIGSIQSRLKAVQFDINNYEGQ